MCYIQNTNGFGEIRYDCVDCAQFHWLVDDAIAHEQAHQAPAKVKPKVNPELERSIELGKRFEEARKQMDELARDMDALDRRFEASSTPMIIQARNDTIAVILEVLNESGECSAAEIVRNLLKGS